MALWFALTRLLTVINLGLLLGLSYVWVRNYRALHTRFTLGFILFGAFLLTENAYALYIYVLDPTTSHWFAEIPARYNVAIMTLTLFEFAALAVLSWMTFESGLRHRFGRA
ncbi:MAG: hypothetical protein ABEJ06_04770 [Haloarculaceae archaeon]